MRWLSTAGRRRAAAERSADAASIEPDDERAKRASADDAILTRLRVLVPGNRFLFARGKLFAVELVDRQDRHRRHSAHQPHHDPEHCAPPLNGRIVVSNHGNIALGDGVLANSVGLLPI